SSALPVCDAALFGRRSDAATGAAQPLGGLPSVRRAKRQGERRWQRGGEPMTALLEARQVSKVFGGGLFDKRVTVALDDFSFSVETAPPRVTAVVGESGSGKTTLARLLLGLITPTSGQVLYNGHNLQNLPSSERRQFLRDVQMIFQDP